MGNRGSKTYAIVQVKEQRVEDNSFRVNLDFKDDTSCLKNSLFKDNSIINLDSKLRFSLMGIENYYRISNPSKKKFLPLAATTGLRLNFEQIRKFNTYSRNSNSSTYNYNKIYVLPYLWAQGTQINKNIRNYSNNLPNDNKLLKDERLTNLIKIPAQQPLRDKLEP